MVGSGVCFPRAPLLMCVRLVVSYAVTPNLLVIPPQLALYMSLAPDEKIT
jgi:hypothetical protein